MTSALDDAIADVGHTIEDARADLEALVRIPRISADAERRSDVDNSADNPGSEDTEDRVRQLLSGKLDQDVRSRRRHHGSLRLSEARNCACANVLQVDRTVQRAHTVRDRVLDIGGKAPLA